MQRLIINMASQTKVQWLFNDTRYRHSVDRETLVLLPSGTTSNESLHHELNHWFRETVPWLHWLCVCHVRISICQTSLSYQGRHAQGYPGDEASSFPIREGLVQTASTASESSGSDQASRQG